MDLFDWLSIIRRLRDEGLTQAQIGERVGWSREHITPGRWTGLIRVLDLAKRRQEGRVSEEDDTNVTFDFSEWWFRTSGLYGLCPEHQLRLMEAFIRAGSRLPSTRCLLIALFRKSWIWRRGIKRAVEQVMFRMEHLTCAPTQRTPEMVGQADHEAAKALRAGCSYAQLVRRLKPALQWVLETGYEPPGILCT